MNAIETKELKKKYKSTVVLNGVNIHIPEGSIYGLVGANGAGKTTFIKLINGVILPTDGNVLYWGQNTAPKGSLSAIAERPALYPYMHAYDHFMIQAGLLGRSIEKKQIDNMLSICGLEDLIGGQKKVHAYSLGMKQRLGLALSLLGDPRMISLDEPTNGLDPNGVKQLRELICNLNREQNITFLISSHNLAELGKIATTYGFLDHGNLMSELSADQLREISGPSVLLKLDRTEGVDSLLLENGVKNFRIDSKENTLTVQEDIPRDTILRLVMTKYHILDMQSCMDNLEKYFFSIQQSKSGISEHLEDS